jgi:hypothetical protein
MKTPFYGSPKMTVLHSMTKLNTWEARIIGSIPSVQLDWWELWDYRQ